MEQKCLKTSVYINDTVYSDFAELAIDADFSLPDYCTDVSKIFKCRALPRIAAKTINGNTLSLEGAVAISLLYADKDDKLCSYEYQYPFVKNLEAPADLSGANVRVKLKCEYINCRAVTGRKIDLHGAVGIHIKAFKRKCADIVSDFDDSFVELKRGIAPATSPMGYAEKYLLLEEDIRIGQEMHPVKSILRCDANSCVKETKIINGKAVVKGELTVSLLYCAENNCHPQPLKTVVPFSQIIDVEGINDSCLCETKSEVAFFDIKPKLNSMGESKCLSLNAKILLSCEAYCPNEIAVILDAFSRKCEASIQKNKVCFEKIIHNVSETYHCKKNIETEENISSVIDMWVNVGSYNTRFENSEMIIIGSLIAGMIVTNEKDNALYLEKTIDFEYKCPVKSENGNLWCEPQLEILSCGYTITSANAIELIIELGINAAVYEKCDMSLISDIELNEQNPIVRSGRNAMTVYFPSNNENVWDIARTYNASVEEIMRINELDREILSAGRMILVPIM